jgi:hypothetical protein
MVTLHIEGVWEKRLEELSGLDGTPKEELARRLLQRGLEQELADLLAEVRAVAEQAASSGGSRELTEEDWATIMTTRPEDVDAGSLAVPPGWVRKP